MIAITLESIGQPLRASVVVAAKAGCSGMVFDATGPLGPDTLGDTARREVRHLLQSHLLSPVALRCPLRRGLDEIDGLEARLERLRKAMQLSFDLGARLILLGIGAIPAEATDPGYQRMLTAVTELAQYGDRIGCRIALDVGLEPVEQLLGFITKLDTGSLGVSLDPATLLIEKQPIEATVFTTKSLLVHTYARDAIPRRIDRPAKEVAVGHGDIDWLSWLGTLEACNYAGAYTIKQTPGGNPQTEVTASVQFLKKLGVR
jgi:sugar phosphate isomerase/epimerase